MSPLFVFTLVCIFNGVVFGRYADIAFETQSNDGCIPDCDSEIYCKGVNKKGEHTLLHDVQMARIYEDGTTFVKSRMKYSEAEILKKYAAAKDKKADKKLSSAELEKFVSENFKNQSLLNGTLPDYTDNPPILKKIENAALKEWILKLNQLWKTLSRDVPKELEQEEKSNETRRSSYDYVPNTFVVAGGRFDEMYYWDTYWIIKGLLSCGLKNTTKGIIGNMVHLIKKYGYIPNGNRIYYSKRSQPPMLTQMVDTYYKETNDESIIKDNLKYLESEFEWWLKNRKVEVKKGGRTYHLFRYHAVGCYPRAESYKEDFELLENYEPQDPEIAKVIYGGIRSAAESGWDFSSRHMRNPENAKNMQDGLRDMNPAQFAYVELNSILYSNAKLLGEWERKFGDEKKADVNDKWASKFLDAIENVLWNEEVGMWLDYDILSGKSRNYFYASNFAALWSNAYKKNATKVELTVKYLERNQMVFGNLTSEHFGLPTSGANESSSKQQWDYPNVWAPLQSFVIRGLKESNNPTAEKVAYNLATSFMKTSYKAYENDKEMYEKYNASVYGEKGGKGEYGCATGFGWTNGLVFELFNLWNCFPLSDNIKCPNAPKIE
ncbi:trehalase-like [Planococcus citri]|uniref:trehalase-like n=1 Tax=Planococcus citri TaxID=170843 RepID=UPI0031F8B294